MKNLIFILLVFIGFQSCKTKDIVVKNGQVVSFKRGVPNGILMNDTLYCDETEVANTDYREYLYWVERVYGFNSQTFQNALPDTMASSNYGMNCKEYRDSFAEKDPYLYESGMIYFRHPSYNGYPVIGLTYEQTINYTNWRTDRVLEVALLHSKLIQFRADIDSSNHFTVERYALGQYRNYKPPKNLYFAKFRLPTIEEWELCVKQKNSDDWGIDSIHKAVIKYKKEEGAFFLTKEVFMSALERIKREKKTSLGLLIPFTRPTFSFFHYPNCPVNMIGNVAEMTASKGIAKGGSWSHTLEESKISNNILYEGQQAWLGFRNVCTWVKLEDFNKKITENQ